MLKSITECQKDSSVCRHCRFHFPQFRPFTEEMLVEVLKRVLAEDNPKLRGEGHRHDDYYKTTYPHWRELNKEYEEILAMLGKGRDAFVAACGRLMKIEKSYIYYPLFLDLQGDVAEFIQCCR